MHDVVVVAGGGSQRMGGRDKLALRDRSGRTLLSAAVAGALATGATRVVVVGPTRPLDLTEVGERASASRVVWTIEDPPDGGPVAGIAAALAVVRPDVPAGPVTVEGRDVAGSRDPLGSQDAGRGSDAGHSLASPASGAVAVTTSAVEVTTSAVAVTTGAVAVTTGVVAVTTGDAPAAAEALPALLAEVSAAGPGTAAVLLDEGGRRTLCLAFHREDALAALARMGPAHGRSVRAFLDAMDASGVRVVEVPDTWGAVDDVDTPEDAERMGWHD